MAQVWVSEQPELDGERFLGITERAGQHRKSRGVPLITYQACCPACRRRFYPSSTFQALRHSDEHLGLSRFLFAVTLAPAVGDNC